jgi:hypothetical protein
VAQRVLESSGARIGLSGDRSFRAVTHYWVGSRDVDTLLEHLKLALST